MAFSRDKKSHKCPSLKYSAQYWSHRRTIQEWGLQAHFVGKNLCRASWIMNWYGPGEFFKDQVTFK